MPRLVSAFALLLMLALPAHAERVLVGYYAIFGGLPVEQIPWDRLTHVCHAFLPLDANGEFVTDDRMPNPALTADGRKNGVPVLVTVGGGRTLQGLEKATETAESTTALAKQIIRLVVDGVYDGVDLNWEFPRSEATRDGHARLILELRRLLDRVAQRRGRDTPYLLTATVNPTPFFGEFVDADRIVPAVDWLSVMTYDMSGVGSREAAHHAPLFASSKDPERETRSVAAAMRYWETERGVPKEKLVVGAPLFGRVMPAAEPLGPLDASDATKHRAMGFAAVRKLVGEGWPAKWDNESRAPWLIKPAAKEKPSAGLPLTPITDAEDAPAVIAYDDRNSIHMKTMWTREQGYRGLFFWAVHQDRMPDGRHWLLEAAGKAWPAE